MQRIFSVLLPKFVIAKGGYNQTCLFLFQAKHAILRQLYSRLKPQLRYKTQNNRKYYYSSPLPQESVLFGRRIQFIQTYAGLQIIKTNKNHKVGRHLFPVAKTSTFRGVCDVVHVKTHFTLSLLVSIMETRNVALTFESVWTKSYNVTIQMRPFSGTFAWHYLFLNILLNIFF